MPAAVAIITTIDTERLRYAIDVLFRQWLALDYAFYKPHEAVGEKTVRITYGITRADALCIPACGLLEEAGVDEIWHKPKTGYWQGFQVLFPDDDCNDKVVSFDLLAAIFWMITRYEEYLPFTPDKHDRFPHTASFIYEKGWLQQPIVDKWVEAFRKLLERQFHEAIAPYPFTLQPTYDIDIAWSYLHKGWKRSCGALLKDVVGFKSRTFINRLKTLAGKALDEYDSFGFLHQLHNELSVRPIYFLLCAEKASAFDKNNDRALEATQDLFRTLSIKGEVGIHPSYFTKERENLLADEIQYLSRVVTHDIKKSRQHYIRLQLPHVYQKLLQQGITEEYSMGYTACAGFRAGTARPFFFYDLSIEKKCDLLVYPFFFMDTAAHFEEGKNVTAAFEELYALTDLIREQGGVAIPVFHNFSLGTDPQWKGWREAYERYLKNYF